ncbi:MAG: BMP family ABC transporter substrate-binding protein [Boseongicola sp. SB0677_bin_26]|nr:BMP family ABC transporter substrate-binding protein [Boseongicola sp. SB0665_bin_10]MYG26399.1 BMP family ABC transporter substrate-binding protein [Boseongicola sp. SB0677_bin_26]
MTFTQKTLGGAAALAIGASACLAEPALMYDLGGKFDKSFNEAAYNGAQRWAEETGNSYREIEVTAEAQRVQFATRLAEAGFNPVVVLGFQNAATLEEVAPKYPDTSFVLIDMVVDLPNVRSVIFQEHEGSYLVGMLAAMASESNTVGFIGGMDVPLIRHFGCGYAQGAKAVNPDVTVIANMTGTTPAAWNDPVKGGELTKAQISQGADVIYAAAGGTGVGVLQAAADADVLSIGVDSNQNHLHPGQVLTSMLKRVDNAVFNAFSDGAGLDTGIVSMGLSDDGVGYALDEHNAPLISDEMKAAVDEAREKIIAGEIEVVSYYENDSCPAHDF